MKDKEEILSEYIDSLNAEKKPKEFGSPELKELFAAVRQVKSLKEPSLPDHNYPKRIAKDLSIQQKQNAKAIKTKRAWYIGAGTVAAVFIVLILNLTLTQNNIVYAMDQAFQSVKAYHGVLELIQTNGEGTEMLQVKREVWANKSGSYLVEEIKGQQKGMITANNGKQKWQIRPDAKQVYMFSAFPDPYAFTFELGKEIENVKNALSTKIAGEVQISGRTAIEIEVAPKGGATYKLWIDKETKLPIKKQSAMQNGIQYTIIFKELKFMDAIPVECLIYKLPSGYEEINISTEQLVNNIEEAEKIAGFQINAPKAIPNGFRLDSITVDSNKEIVRFYYESNDQNSKVIVLQSKVQGTFKPAFTAILGKIGSNVAEIQSPISTELGILTGGGAYAGITDFSSVRWQQNGFEYTVLGDAPVDTLGLFVKEMTMEEIELPVEIEQASSKPQIDVKVDLSIEENEQKSVDAGHAPWRLDPIMVAQIFVSLQISPEGIQGEYPIQYENFKIMQNTGEDAILEIESDKTKINKVYLRKLIRQDNTGIWTVIGYDISDQK